MPLIYLHYINLSGFAFGFCLPPVITEVIFITTRYITGIKNTPIHVATIIPPTTAIPILLRAAAPAPVASASGKTADDEGKRSHDDRTQTQFGSFKRCLEQRHTRIYTDFRKFDNQNCILCGKTHNNDHTNLHVNTDLQIENVR